MTDPQGHRDFLKSISLAAAAGLPSGGNDPDSDFYLGKLVPGCRRPENGPASFVAPDLNKLPFKRKKALRNSTSFRSGKWKPSQDREKFGRTLEKLIVV